MKKMKIAFILLLFLLVLISTILMIQDSIQFRKAIIFFTDRFNDQFCYDQQTCITLPKGYLPVVSGKTNNGDVFSESMFIDRDGAIKQHVSPESIHVSLLRPNRKASARIDIFKLHDINKEISSFVDINKLRSNENFVQISTKKTDTVYFLKQNLKIVINNELNSTGLLKEIFSHSNIN